VDFIAGWNVGMSFQLAKAIDLKGRGKKVSNAIVQYILPRAFIMHRCVSVLSLFLSIKDFTARRIQLNVGCRAAEQLRLSTSRAYAEKHLIH